VLKRSAEGPGCRLILNFYRQADEVPVWVAIFKALVEWQAMGRAV
jgi:hypothetical protein